MIFDEYADRDMLVMALADRLASDLRTQLQQRDRVLFVVPGGTTPAPIFDVLSGSSLEWDRVSIMLSDERWVPETSERSNTALVKRHLLQGQAANAKFVPSFFDAATPEEGIPSLEGAIEDLLPISVLLLGMGADMHTASIFPGADRLEDALSPTAPLLVPMRAPGAPEPRVTLPAHVLANAMASHVVITGAEKRAALERAVHLPPEEAPVAAVLKTATIHWAD